MADKDCSLASEIFIFGAFMNLPRVCPQAVMSWRSGVGTKRNSRGGLTMSVVRARPEVAGRGAKRRGCPWLRENELSAMIRLAICRGQFMKRFVEGADRGQSTLLPECLDEWVEESNTVRVVDSFVDALDLADLGFEGAEPAATGRPAYHPSVLLKLYIYGYLNRVQSSRRLEREAGRNLEVIWLLGRLVPDDKVIADFRKDNGPAIRKVCASFVNLCRQMGLLAKASVAIDGSKFKAVNNRDRNFTRGKIDRRRAQLEESVARYLSQLDTIAGLVGSRDPG